jgi:hypothetical protein
VRRFTYLILEGYIIGRVATVLWLPLPLLVEAALGISLGALVSAYALPLDAWAVARWGGSTAYVSASTSSAARPAGRSLLAGHIVRHDLGRSIFAELERRGFPGERCRRRGAAGRCSPA